MQNSKSNPPLSMQIKCSICGKMHFYRDPCPYMFKVAKQKAINQQAKEHYFGDAPNIFVGRFGYPNINVGILNAEEYQNNDNPLLWSRENYNINSIVDLRLSLINSYFKTTIKSFNDKLLQLGQEVAMAEKPVDMEIDLQRMPQFRITTKPDQEISPHGPNVELKKARITENPKIPTKIDKAVSDTDLKAGEALKTLFKKETDEHYLTKLLSSGNLGVKIQRKLVPTRWAITAVDDTLGKGIISEIKDFPQSNYLAYAGNFLGNYYLILFFPDVWGYELFESAVGDKTNPNAEFMTDYEDYSGRKIYAEQCAGGYYAARLSILEHLRQARRQGSCLCLRFITDEYYAQLGVWVVREAVRKTMQNKPIEFASKELMMNFAEKYARKKFNYSLNNMTERSRLLKRITTQRKLSVF